MESIEWWSCEIKKCGLQLFLQTLYSCVMNWYYYAFPFTQVNKEFCTNVDVCSCLYFFLSWNSMFWLPFFVKFQAQHFQKATTRCIIWQFYLTAMFSIARTAILKQKSQQNAVDTPSTTKPIENSELVCIIWNNNLLHQVTFSKWWDKVNFIFA